MVTVEIITIGNEILLGLVEDTNSNYLCRVVRGMAGRARHIAVVRDEIDAIADSLRASMARGSELIFTCGGLGRLHKIAREPVWSRPAISNTDLVVGEQR